MQTLVSVLQEKASNAIKKVFPNLKMEDTFAEVTLCTQKDGAHYQCNSALKLAKILGESPREIAEKIVSSLESDEDFKNMVFKIEIAGPGFINLTLDKKFLSSELNKVFKDPHLGAVLPKKKQKVIVEFSSPNVAKELHVGHLRSTIIGDCIARFFEFLDMDVLRLNHIGDWGTQFGMLIAYIKENEKSFLKKEKDTDLSVLMNWYKESKKEFDSNDEFKKRAQEEVVRLQSGERETLDMWKWICEVSRKAYLEIYNLLDVKIEERGESYYNPVLKGMVEDLENKGLITVSDGAKCIFLEGFKNREGNPMPYMVQKSDGGFTYDTTDLAAMKNRAIDEKADRIIVVTDLGQSLHFKMLYTASVKAKYLDPLKTEFNHVGFGLVLGPDGKKFKTRSGETEKLIDLIYGAINRAKKILLERDPLIKKKDLEKLSKILGVGAVKYSDLSCHRQKDYKFSYDKMLKFEGNTAVFLLYSFVRVMGIKRKVKNDVEKIIEKGEIELSHPSEVDLGFHLRRFPESLEVFKKDLLPNRISDYLYELAEKFNAFFRDCKVIGEKEMNSRLVLCEFTARVMKRGLFILGIETTDYM
jgi:arginyl-tRNA synthetase